MKQICCMLLFNIVFLNAIDEQLDELASTCYNLGHSNLTNYTHFSELYKTKEAYMYLKSSMEFLFEAAASYIELYNSSNPKNETIKLQIKEIHSTINIYFPLLKFEHQEILQKRFNVVRSNLESFK